MIFFVSSYLQNEEISYVDADNCLNIEPEPYSKNQVAVVIQLSTMPNMNMDHILIEANFVQAGELHQPIEITTCIPLPSEPLVVIFIFDWLRSCYYLINRPIPNAWTNLWPNLFEKFLEMTARKILVLLFLVIQRPLRIGKPRKIGNAETRERKSMSSLPILLRRKDHHHLLSNKSFCFLRKLAKRQFKSQWLNCEWATKKKEMN